MNYFQQDVVFLVVCVVTALALPVYLAARGLLGRGWPAYLLMILLTLAGAADLVFLHNAGTTPLLLADSVNVFCYLFSLTLFAHYSLIYSAARLRPVRLWFYLPALLLSLCYFLTPWLVGGVIRSPSFGFRLAYEPAFWLLPLFGLLAALLVVALSCATVFSLQKEAVKDRSLYLIFVLFLTLFFFSSSLLMPFLAGTVNFSSTLPLALALLVIFYSSAHNGYFLSE